MPLGGKLIVLAAGAALFSQGTALAAPMPTAGLCSSAPLAGTPLPIRLIGSASTRVDLARGEWCRADCAQFSALPPTKDEVLLSESVESLPKGGILLTRLSENTSQRVFLVYQSWTEFRWPVREVLTLIHCGPEAHQ